MRQMKNSRRVSTARPIASVEPLEDRQLMSTNAWKAAVSGSWADASKWSLGHVPTSTEDVAINVAGTYTVSLTSGYGYGNKVDVGGGTGTQTLAVSGTGYLSAYSVVNAQAGDAINLGAGGHIYSYSAANTPATLNGTVTLSGTSSSVAYFYVGGADYTGSVGSVNFATGGSVSYANQLGGYQAVIGTGMTLHGKTADLFGSWTNNGTIKAEGSATDTFEMYGVANKGAIIATGGSSLVFDYLNNTAGHTVTIAGGSATFYYDFTNAGTINISNAKLKYAMNITAGAYGTVNRTNSPATFSGSYDGGGKAFAFDSAGKWNWYGGLLKNGTYDASATNALVLDPALYGSGQLSNVTLSSDVNIPAGTYISAYGNVTLATGKRIVLNGKVGAMSGFYVYPGATLGGNGEVVFNTAGLTSINTLGSSTGTIGAGIVVHGQSGQVTSVTNNGTILADTAGKTILTNGITNNGNFIAAPGTIELYRYTQTAAGAMTVGIGGTAAGSTFGQFKFADATYAPALAGKINAVSLNGYAPAAGASFGIATFVKGPTGTFSTPNLDIGGGRAFDLTSTASGLTLKAKTVAGPFATRDASGNVTITGTSGNDTIGASQSLDVLYTTVNGKTSVFFDPGVKGVTVRAGAGNDTVTYAGNRGVALYGEAGNDSLVGSNGNDTLDGGTGNDTLLGNAGDDRYVFTAATVAEVDVVGEAANYGVDTLDFSALTTAVTVDLNSDASLATMLNRTVKTAGGGQAANFENVTGGSGADKITGNGATNVLHGGKGNDTLTGGAGADSLYGEDDVDTLFGGGDNVKDMLDGGIGTDIKGSADAIDTLVSVP